MKKILMAIGIIRLFGVAWSMVAIIKDVRKHEQLDEGELSYYRCPTGYVVVFTRNFVEWFPSKQKVDLVKKWRDEGLI